ncbi:MAG: glycosyl hydrolase family 8 [Solirubrobacteraceae bacterium]
MGVSLITAGATSARDPRLRPARWQAQAAPRLRWRLGAIVLINAVLAVFYFGWLLTPGRAGTPGLFALLLAAELFNLIQAIGFWWTVLGIRRYRARPWEGEPATVDVLIPVYGEPVEIVEPTVAAARRMRGAEVRVHLLDDGNSGEMRSLAERLSVDYVTRARHTGAKAGNINHALGLTEAPYVLVLDCDHVPEPHLLLATLGHLQEPRVAFVQTPQYYANAAESRVAAAAWGQQALFFGAIAQGKDGHGAMFCAGTNVVFSRLALESVGGFPEDSLTEDFALSIRLHERGWQTRYVPEVLAKGLGPEDMASYVSQQQRWARGCLGGIAAALRARLPWRQRVQYLLSSMYFLSGWTVLAYVSFPIVRILTGTQPLAGASADQFLLHFAPYFCAALSTVAVAGVGIYTWRSYTLAVSTFWIHVRASVLALLRRRGRFVVTPKSGADGPQLRAGWPSLVLIAALLGVGAFGVARRHDPATLNNVAFAMLHVVVQGTGVWPAIWGGSAALISTGSLRLRMAAERRRYASVAGLGTVAISVIAVGVVIGLAVHRHAPQPLPSPTALLARATSSANRFLSRYEAADGRVIRLDQGGDTVSEGQAYAMQVGVATGDRWRFDAAWSWTRAHLQLPDGLLASHYANGIVVDSQPAADADLDAADALARAASRFGVRSYAVAARRIARAILARETIATAAGPTLAAGPWAVPRRIVNPSYFSPSDFTELALVDRRDAGTWLALGRVTQSEIAALIAGGHLPPDWAVANLTGGLQPIGAPGSPGAQPGWSFDAARVSIRYGASCDPRDRLLAAQMSRTLAAAGTPTPYALTLTGAPLTSNSHPVSLVSAAGAANADGRLRRALELLRRASALDARFPTYYGSAWIALGRLWLTTGSGCTS